MRAERGLPRAPPTRPPVNERPGHRCNERLTWRQIMRKKVSVSAIALLTFVLAVAGTPAEAKQSATPAPSERQCVMAIDKPQDQGQYARILAYECFPPGQLATIQESLLMTWYEHADYGGESTFVTGSSGPCDAEGYKIQTYSWVRRISSYKVWNHCDRSTAYVQTNCSGINREFTGNVPYVPVLNDNIGCFRVRSN